MAEVSRPPNGSKAPSRFATNEINHDIAAAEIGSDGTEGASEAPAPSGEVKRRRGRPRKPVPEEKFFTPELEAALEPEQTAKNSANDAVRSEKPRRPRTSEFNAYNWLKSNTSYWCDKKGNAYLCIFVNGTFRNVPVLSELAKYIVSKACYETTGLPLDTTNIEKALRLIEGDARILGPFRKPIVRVGWDGEDIVIDLGGEDYRICRVNKYGYSIEPMNKLPFIRSESMKMLPIPEAGGKIDDLRQFLNTENESDFVLIVKFIIGAFRPNGPYELLFLCGSHGSGKSSVLRLVRGMTDPNDIVIRKQPDDLDSLRAAAKYNHVLAFDNSSRFDQWLSDALCIISTGGGIVTRKLYSDDDEVSFDGMRPIAVTSIVNVATAADLQSRSLFVNLRSFDEKNKSVTEGELRNKWVNFESQIFGVILDGLSSALRNFKRVEKDERNLPRMADQFVWAVAAEPGLGFEPGTFQRALQENSTYAIVEAFQSDPVAMAILSLVPKEGDQWSGTTLRLLDDLNATVSESTKKSRSWPQTTQSLASKIARLNPILISQGIIFHRTRGHVRSIFFEHIKTAHSDTEPDAARESLDE